MIVIRNRGFSTASAENTTLRVGRVAGGVFEEFSSQPLAFDAAPGDLTEFEVRFVLPPETTILRVLVDPIGSETLTDNNEADLLLGVRAPKNLACAETAGGDDQYLVALSWENDDAYDAILVYRNGRLHAELPGDVVSYFDATAGVRSHEYVVRGRIRDSLSDPAGSTCEFTVEDCNDNGIADLVDMLTGTSPDCNGNLRPDECDLGKLLPAHQVPNRGDRVFTRSGTCAWTNDRNCNGIPDDCE